MPILGTRRSTTGLVSADLGDRSNERRGLAAAADGGELGSDLNGPPVLRERGVDGVPPPELLLEPPPGVEGRWLEDGVEGRWPEDGVLGLALPTDDSFGPDLSTATHCHPLTKLQSFHQQPRRINRPQSKSQFEAHFVRAIRENRHKNRNFSMNRRN